MNIRKQVKYVNILDQTMWLTPSGTIYKATHSTTTQPLLVKVISKDRAAQDDQFLNNLKKESFIIQTTRSPNLFSYLDYIETEKYFYIVCQHTLGPSLEEYISQQPPLEEENILIFFLQVLNGYSEFFKVKTPHMNIASDMIHFDLTDKTLKITPFYYAKSFQLKKHCSRVSSFMAPEFLSNPEISFNYTCDIWSLGAVLFFITFGTPPFKGDTVQELIYNIELLLKDVVSYGLRSDGRKFSPEFKDFMESFFHKNPSFRITPEKLITHPCLVSHKQKYEALLLKSAKTLYGESKENPSKYSPDINKALLMMIENKETITKEKNMKTLENLDKYLSKACSFLKLYNDCSGIFLGNWIERSTSPKVLLVPNSASFQSNGPFIGASPSQNKPVKPIIYQRGATIGDIGDIPIIDEEDDIEGHKSPDLKKLKQLKQLNTLPVSTHKNKPHAKTMVPKCKTLQNIPDISRRESMIEIEENNFDMTEEQAVKAIIPKYYNELDSYNFLFEAFQSIKEMEKDFKEQVLLARFSLIKYIYFRFMMFERKVIEKVNVFSLPEWDKLKNGKEYIKIMEIVPQKQDKQKWLQLYLDIGEETDQWLDELYKRGELSKFSTNEKHFLEREKLLHVIMFYAKNFKEAFHNIIANLLKTIRTKDEDLKKIKGKVNPKFLKIGLMVLKVLEISRMVGFDRFDKKMKHCFREIRESLDELKTDMIETLFKQGLESMLKIMDLKTKKK